MSIKKIKPITPGQRFKIINSFKEVISSYPKKSLIKGKSKSGGRNNSGKITIKYRGGGKYNKKYRIIDFKRRKFGISAIVKSIEYDPNRSAFISLLFYKDGEKRYMIHINNLNIGDNVFSEKSKNNIIIGNCMFLRYIPLGTIISCIEFLPGKGAAIARSAGTYAQVVAKEGKYVTIKMPSGEIRMILNTCMATIGSISNPNHQLEILGKAGRNRWMGRRPRTRGVAMNPIDHPMGGGEGKASGGHPRDIKGRYSKGFKTSSKRRKLFYKKYIIKNRKK